MVKLIKFKLRKENGKILFTLLEYNRTNPYNGRTFTIDFNKKKVRRDSSWIGCHIDSNRFAVSFSGGFSSREFKYHNSLLRIGSGEYGKDNEIEFELKQGEDIDVMCNSIIKAFEILSLGIK